MIRFDKVEKRYKSGVDALKGISFKVESGEFVFIIGKSGSGKSTLMKCITCEERPTKGDVYIDGFRVSDMSRALVPVLRRQIGMIYQDFRLISTKTVSENIAFAGEIIGVPRKIINDTVQFVLNIVGLKDKADCYPNELSGGEQQRVAIARALFNNPQLIVADEPTGNLDPETSENIMALLSEINKSGTTVLICTHDSNLVDRMKKRVIEIDKGLIVRDEFDADYSGTRIQPEGFGGMNMNEVNDALVSDEEEEIEPARVLFGDEDDEVNQVSEPVTKEAEEVKVPDEEVKEEVFISETSIEEFPVESVVFGDETPETNNEEVTEEKIKPSEEQKETLDIPEVNNGLFKKKDKKKKSIKEIMDSINSDIDILEDDEE